MSRKVGDWIDSYLEFAEMTEPPDSYKVWTAISTVAACLKRKCRLEFGSETFYPNMYVILVGRSGRCRKGTAMKPAHAMLRELGVKMSADATTRAALVQELGRSSDTNLDRRTGRMELHASLTIFSKEFTVFLGYNELQMLADLTDWYDCDPRWVNRTKTQGVEEIINVWLNIMGATTPDALSSSLPTEAIGGGFTSRIIFIYENRKGKHVPFPYYKDELADSLKHDLEQILMLSGKFRFTKKFMEQYTDWYLRSEECPPFTDDRFSGYLSRRPTHLLKLCMIMSASRTDDMILTPLDLSRSLTLLEEAELKMPMAFGGVGRSPVANVMNRVAVYIMDAKVIPFWELYARVSHDADEWTFERILKSLEAMRMIKVKGIGKDRTVELWEEEDGHKQAALRIAEKHND